MLQMFENQYKTDFHWLTSGPARVPGDFSAVVLAQGSGSCSKTAPQTLQLFTLPLWKFTPLLVSGGSQPSCLLGNSGTRFLVLLQSRPSREGDCHRLNWHGFKPGDLKKKKTTKKGQKENKDIIHRAILHAKGQGAKHANSCFVEPAKLPLPATSVTHFSS